MNLETYLVVKPAYGRQLDSKAAIRRSFQSLQDFQVLGPPHARPGSKVNAQEVEEHSLTLEVRYGKSGEKLMILTKSDLED